MLNFSAERVHTQVNQWSCMSSYFELFISCNSLHSDCASGEVPRFSDEKLFKSMINTSSRPIGICSAGIRVLIDINWVWASGRWSSRLLWHCAKLPSINLSNMMEGIGGSRKSYTEWWSPQLWWNVFLFGWIRYWQKRWYPPYTVYKCPWGRSIVKDQLYVCCL